MATIKKNATPGGKKQTEKADTFKNELNSRAYINYNGRPSLSRRAKYFIKLLEGYVPEETLSYVYYEFGVESRRDQNDMADTIFAVLVDSPRINFTNESRLMIKVNQLAQMILSFVDPFRLSRCE